MNDPVVQLTVDLYKLGRSPEAISNRIKKPVEWVRQIIMTLPAQAPVEIPNDQMIMDDNTELWNEEWTQYAVERLTPIAFKTLEEVMRDTSNSASARLNAALGILRYQPKLKEAKEIDEDKITRLQFDEQTLRILRDITQEERERL